jgi:alpha-2-macroglobulin
LIAKNGPERGYLKIDDGSSLALSRFDVSGEEVKNGLKGFLFGERGVWRPGDTMFLSFILSDQNATLPKDYPLQFEMYSPNGQLFKKMVQTSVEGGFNVFKVKTDASSPTGNWSAKVKVGNNVFEKRLKVETIMPNRLKINLDFGNDPALGAGSQNAGSLHANWLFGATAGGLKAKIDAALTSSYTSFKNFDEYIFDNPTGTFSAETKTIFDAALDANGNATVTPAFAAGTNAPGMLNANLTVKVFEPGGNFSIDNVNMPYHPYASYAGIKLPEAASGYGYYPCNKNIAFNIVDVDTKGNLVGGATTMSVELYKVQWRWWWDNSGDGFSNFTQDDYNKLISKQDVALVNGKGNWNFKVATAEWGRYLVLVRDTKSGHTTGSAVYVDDPYYGSSADRTDASAATMLTFKSDKEKYNVGDNVSLTIPSTENGRALISIENGSKVLKTYWVDTKKGNTNFSFKAEEGYSPNVFVNVSMIQPHAQTLNDLPIRMYGVIPVLVEDKNTVLKPEIKMAESIEPEKPASITISEANGKEMYYSIALVDEGLLDVTRYKTPNPHEAFYAREALGVKSWDLYDYVIGAWGGELERILTIGGSDDAAIGQNKRANRFKPVVQYLGPFKLSRGSSVKHDFTLPNYIGSIKAMVVACNANAYGSADKVVAVKKPLMMLATMPRVLGPSENIKIPVTVFAMEKGIKNVNIKLESNPFIEAVGATSQDVAFAEVGEQVVNFDVKVKPTTGIGKVKLIATSESISAVYEVEIDIRNPNPPITSITEMALQPGQNWNTSVAAIGMLSTANATLELSSIPNMNLEKRLSYLISYPHGCVEQTTSAVFPQLVLGQMVELSEAKKVAIANNIKAAINKLRGFQTSDGGFAYWPGQPRSDEWGNNYAGHFLMEAQAQGYDIPGNMLNNWKLYQRSKALAWSPSNNNYYGEDLTQSYRVYLLALAKAPELGAMNRLKEYKFLTPEGKWQLAAAYQLAGQPAVAKQLVAGLALTYAKRDYWGYTYGSSLRDEAMILETMTTMGNTTTGKQVLDNVAKQLAQESWYSTQTTAYSLLAIAHFCGVTSKSATKLVADANLNNTKVNINSNSYINQQNIPLSNGSANVTVTNKGNSLLFVRVINKGTPLTGEGVVVNNNPSVLQVSTQFLTQESKPLDIANLKQGTDFVAKITIKNPGVKGNYTQMALNQIFPSGWEIINTRLYDNAGAFQSSPSEYRDIRDDRVYTYFNVRAGETLTYYVLLNAAYLGKYYWAGTYCEAMYDNSVSGGTTGKWVEVSQ